MYQQKRYQYVNNGKNKTESDVLKYFGSSISKRMYINIVFPANIHVFIFFSHSNIENTQWVGNVSVKN